MELFEIRKIENELIKNNVTVADLIYCLLVAFNLDVAADKELLEKVLATKETIKILKEYEEMKSRMMLPSQKVKKLFVELHKNKIDLSIVVRYITVNYAVSDSYIAKVLEVSRARMSNIVHKKHKIKEHTYLRALILLDNHFDLDVKEVLKYAKCCS